MKRDQIFNELKQRIATGEYAAGEKLPTEFELSAQYAVARGTVRQSLKRLEEEGYLERVKSKGTFIRRPPGKSNADKVISFLIPYPGYIRPNNDPVFITFSQAFYGAIRAASEAGWRVETVPFSRTNNNSDIDWKALEHIGEDSRVMIFNHWYYPAFDALLKWKARVGIIRYFSHVKSPWDHCFENWIDAVVDTKKVASDAVHFLYTLGCRKILNANWYYNDAYNEKPLGYREAADCLGLERLELDYDIFYGKPHYGRNVANAIRNIWEKTHFDALFADNPEHYFTEKGNIYQTLGIPENVKILLNNDEPQYYLRTSPQVSAFSIDMDRIGYLTAKRLTEDRYTPCRLVFERTLCNRESTGGAYIPPQETKEKEEKWMAMI